MTDYQSVTKNTQRSLPNDRAIPVVVTELARVSLEFGNTAEVATNSIKGYNYMQSKDWNLEVTAKDALTPP
jgi:hypothetical protein